MTHAVAIDVVLSPFGGDAARLLTLAQRAEDLGYDGVWTFDHISSLAALTHPGLGASRDPFTLLGAIAARTERVRLGVLVANMNNRHPAQLALAVDTLTSLAPARTVCGIGSGAGPGGPFAREDAALGRLPRPAAERRALLAEHLGALRAIWEGRDATGSVATHGLTGVVSQPAPPIVVGAGARATLQLAAELADGVNIVTGLGPRLADQVALVREVSAGRPFEVSVFVTDDGGAHLRPPADLPWEDVPAGVDRLTVLLRP